LVPGLRYRASFDTNAGQSDNADVKLGSLRLAGPSAAAIRRVPGDPNQFTFTAPQSGTMHLVVGWQEELFAADGGPSEFCAGSGPVDIRTEKAKPPKIRARVVGTSAFELVVLGGSRIDQRPLTLAFRFQSGRAVPPSLHAKVSLRYTFTPDQFFQLPRSRQHAFLIDGRGDALTSRVASGANSGTVGLSVFENDLKHELHFGFSLQVIQGGKTIGGMRSGAVCRYVPVRFKPAETRCTHPGFATRP
jgi:hypothetical protein